MFFTSNRLAQPALPSGSSAVVDLDRLIGPLTGRGDRRRERRAPPSRPVFAIVSEELTPYRVHMHRRIAREIPEFKLATVQVLEPSASAWRLTESSINTVDVSARKDAGAGRLSGARRQAVTARNLVRWLNENKPEAVMLVGYHRLPLLGALLWCRLRGVPALLWGDSNVRGDRLKGLKRRVKQSVLPWVLRQYSACLACGSMGQQFFQRYGVKSDRLHLSPVEPDYDQIERLDSSWEEEATKRFGLDNGMRRIVISSRLVGIKRVDLSIRAFAAIAAERAGWEMVILGDGPERAALEALVPAGLKHRVRFMGFVGQQELVTSVYRRSEVLLHAASWEPWALVINEATAAGLAMVTTEAVGAAVELVRDGVNGRVVARDDLDALTDALREVTEGSRARTMGAESRRVLAEWRQKADPVAGLREALRRSGAVA